MALLSFYRQARVDGGIRSGINADGEPVWESFEPGGSEPDPALLWYVDVRCQGEGLPTDREAVRRWFVAQAPAIKAAFQALAEKLRVGFDDEIWPYQYVVPEPPPGTSMKIVCSAVQSLELGTLSRVLRNVAENWEQILEQLSPGEVLT